MSKFRLPVETGKSVAFELLALGVHPRTVKAVTAMMEARPGKVASRPLLAAAVRDASSVLCDGIAGRWAKAAKGPDAPKSKPKPQAAPSGGFPSRALAMNDEDDDADLHEEALRLAERTVKLGYSIALQMGHDSDTAAHAALYAFTQL
jgi:hypothetical protein